MAQEIELKLETQPSIMRKVAELPWLRELANDPPKREKLVTVYFDTAKFKLHDRGLALRLRHSAKGRVQTIKVLRKGTRGPLAGMNGSNKSPVMSPICRLPRTPRSSLW